MKRSKYMSFDQKKNNTRGFRATSERSRISGKSYSGDRNTRKDHVKAEPRTRDYRQYEYHQKEFSDKPDHNEQSNEYILTGRNPIREALKNHHDLEKLLVQKGELSGSAREIVQKAKEQKIQIQVVETGSRQTDQFQVLCPSNRLLVHQYFVYD